MDLTRKLPIVIAIFLVFACKEKLIEPPQDLIPQSEMTELLYDLALIKGLKSTNDNVLKQYDIETMPYLYEKYGVDSLQFVTSSDYYASVPGIYQNMYTNIQNRLEQHIDEIDEQRKQKTDSLRSNNERVRDSIRKNAASTDAPAPVPSEK